MSTVASHYTQTKILDKIMTGLTALNIDKPTFNDLSSVDEFHVGGVDATTELLDQLSISSTDKVLDIGCGIGGAARFVATTYDAANVVGIDLTPEYVAAGNALNTLCGLSSNQVELKVGSGTNLSETLGEEGNQFDKAYMLHVGMNIEDKEKLMADIAAQLKPGGKLAIYDIVRLGANASEILNYPVPWASSAEMDYSSSELVYKTAASRSGLKLVAERNCHARSLMFFEKMAAARAIGNGPPPLGLHILMGDDFPVKMKNIVENIRKERVTPYELIFEKVNTASSKM